MFKVISRISLIAALSLIFTSTAQAAAVEIDCPLQEVRTEITSSLPAGWWQTPQVGRLTDIKLANIGGKPTLMCGYQAYGDTAYILREAPEGATCETTGTGFFCTTPVVDAPRTMITGPFSLKQTWSVDLDTGRSDGGTDIFFQAVTASERYLVPQNGAAIAIAGNRSVNLAGCRDLGYSRNRIPLDRFTEGTYVCVITSEGRYSQFRVNGAAGASPGTMEIGYTTWAN